MSPTWPTKREGRLPHGSRPNIIIPTCKSIEAEIADDFIDPSTVTVLSGEWSYTADPERFVALVTVNFMLVFLLKDGTQASVLAALDFLSDRLGLETFRALFPVILTDNGVEFKDPDDIEHAPNNCQRTRIFYCDPQASWQKPRVEKNHVLLRRIIPKGTSFKDLTKAQVTLATNHVNSVARELFDNKTPFDLFVGENKKKLLDLLDLAPIAPDKVCLKPALLKRKPN